VKENGEFLQQFLVLSVIFYFLFFIFLMLCAVFLNDISRQGGEKGEKKKEREGERERERHASP
jgi:integral membrane sensor domain MASE1